MRRPRHWVLAAVLAPLAVGVAQQAVPDLGSPPRPYVTQTETDADQFERLLARNGFVLGSTWDIDRPVFVSVDSARRDTPVYLIDVTLVFHDGARLVVFGAPLGLVRVRYTCDRPGPVIRVVAPPRKAVTFYCASA